MKTKQYGMRTAVLAATTLLGTSAPAQTFYLEELGVYGQGGLGSNYWLRNWTADFGTDSNAGFFPNGFLGGEQLSPPAASPISVFGGQKVKVSLGTYLQAKYDGEYTATGYLGNNEIILRYIQTGLANTLVAYTTLPIPAKVDIVNDYMSNWIANGDSGRPAVIWSTPVHNKMYVVWAQPRASSYAPTANSATIKRIEYVCNAAKGATSLLGAADKLWNVVADQAKLTNYLSQPNKAIVPYGENDWKILDGTYSGECDEEARLLHRALGILGIASEVKFLRALPGPDRRVQRRDTRHL